MYFHIVAVLSAPEDVPKQYVTLLHADKAGIANFCQLGQLHCPFKFLIGIWLYQIDMSMDNVDICQMYMPNIKKPVIEIIASDPKPFNKQIASIVDSFQDDDGVSPAPALWRPDIDEREITVSLTLHVNGQNSLKSTMHAEKQTIQVPYNAMLAINGISNNDMLTVFGGHISQAIDADSGEGNGFIFINNVALQVGREKNTGGSKSLIGSAKVYEENENRSSQLVNGGTWFCIKSRPIVLSGIRTIVTPVVLQGLSETRIKNIMTVGSLT